MSVPSNGHTGRVNYFREFAASIVVFLVALPLCMGIAIASGVPVSAGLMSGMIGGLVVAVVAGAPLQVSGPAAGLTVIVYGIVQTYGLEYLSVVVLIAGTIQLVAGIARLGQWFRAVSPAVIKGMLAGIGLLIFSSQLHVMVDDAPKGSGLANLASLPDAIAKGIPHLESGTAEERRERTRLLKAFGRIHEQQELIRERVVEAEPSTEEVAAGAVTSTGDSGGPDITPNEPSAETPSVDAMSVDAVSTESAASERVIPLELVEQQKELLESLGRHVEELLALELSISNLRRSELYVAAQKSLRNSTDALQALEDDDWADAVDAELAATKSLSDLLTALKNHDWAAGLGLLTIGVMAGWQLVTWKRLKLVPRPLVAVIVTTLAAAILNAPVLYVEAPESLWAELHVPQWNVLHDADWPALLKAAVVLAVVASAETLLCVTAVDQMHTGPRARYDRELGAQGIGNMICGMVGALPMTGVIVRSAANVNAGATTRWSAWLHGVWLLIFVSVLPGLLQLIPTSCLAGVLVYTGYRLMHPQAVKDLWKYGKGEVAIYAATVITIVSTDLLSGVLTGIGLSMARLFFRFSRLTVDVEGGHGSITLKPRGAATFVRLPVLASVLEQVSPGVVVRVDLRALTCIDHACVELLTNWSMQHEATGGRVQIDWALLHPTAAGVTADPAPQSSSAAE